LCLSRHLEFLNPHQPPEAHPTNSSVLLWEFPLSSCRFWKWLIWNSLKSGVWLFLSRTQFSRKRESAENWRRSRSDEVRPF
jgi:hypothetical protein